MRPQLRLQVVAVWPAAANSDEETRVVEIGEAFVSPNQWVDALERIPAGCTNVDGLKELREAGAFEEKG